MNSSVTARKCSAIASSTLSPRADLLNLQRTIGTGHSDRSLPGPRVQGSTHPRELMIVMLSRKVMIKLSLLGGGGLWILPGKMVRSWRRDVVESMPCGMAFGVNCAPPGR